MTDNRISEVQTTQKEPERERRIFTFKATQLVWLLFGILETLLALRFGLKLIGANPDNPIAVLIYGFTSLFLFPFTGLTGTPAAGSARDRRQRNCGSSDPMNSCHRATRKQSQVIRST